MTEEIEERSYNNLILFRGDSANHVEALIENGDIYCNNIKHFRSSELDEARKDKWEGASLILQSKQLTSFKVGEIELVNDLVGSVIMTNTEPNTPHISHIFCMSHIHEDYYQTSRQIIDPEFYGFGDTITVITDVNQFFERFKKAIEQKGGYNFTYGPVSYVSNNYHGKYNPFMKPEHLSWQQEFRFAFGLPEGNEEPTILSLGSLSDIAATLPMENFKNEILHDDNGPVVNF